MSNYTLHVSHIAIFLALSCALCMKRNEKHYYRFEEVYWQQQKIGILYLLVVRLGTPVHIESTTKMNQISFATERRLLSL